MWTEVSPGFFREGNIITDMKRCWICDVEDIKDVVADGNALTVNGTVLQLCTADEFYQHVTCKLLTTIHVYQQKQKELFSQIQRIELMRGKVQPFDLQKFQSRVVKAQPDKDFASVFADPYFDQKQSQTQTASSQSQDNSLINSQESTGSQTYTPKKRKKFVGVAQDSSKKNKFF